MTNPSNSPTPSKSNSPIPTRPMTLIENRSPTPAFDKKILPSHWSSDKENDGRPIKIEEETGNSNSESQVFPTSLTPPEKANKRTHQSTDDGSGTVQERTGFCPPLRQILEERGPC